jgi:hypothetical protein
MFTLACTLKQMLLWPGKEGKFYYPGKIKKGRSAMKRKRQEAQGFFREIVAGFFTALVPCCKTAVPRCRPEWRISSAGYR